MFTKDAMHCRLCVSQGVTFLQPVHNLQSDDVTFVET